MDEKPNGTFSRQETKYSETLSLGNLNKQNSDDFQSTKICKTEGLTRKKKDSNGVYSDYLIKNRKDVFEKIGLKNDVSAAKVGNPGMRIAKVIETKKSFKDFRPVTGIESMKNKKNTSASNSNKFNVDNKKAKISSISPGKIKLSEMPTMTPKTLSHYNLLKVNIIITF